MGAMIVAWGHTEFGRLEDNLEQLIVRSAREAIDNSRVDPAMFLTDNEDATVISGAYKE